MIRSVVGFAVFTVLALVALKLFFGLVIGMLALLGVLLWVAFWGLVVYLVLRVLAPRMASRVREMIAG